jgi:hypothetical protein
MGELTEQRWAVMSERGCEATGRTYAQALELMRALTGERVSGLFIVTDDAAHRATHHKGTPARSINPNGTKAKVKR